MRRISMKDMMTITTSLMVIDLNVRYYHSSYLHG